MLDETAVYEAVKEILACNKRNVEWLRCMNVGSYLDIKAFYPVMRLKVKGRKEICINRDIRRRCERNMYKFKM